MKLYENYLVVTCERDGRTDGRTGK